MRRILVFVIAATAAAFLWASLVTSDVFAAEATWKSANAITYENNQYTGPTNDSTNKELGLSKETKGYTFIDQGTTDKNGNEKVRQIHVIYFSSSTNTATTAKYRTYTYEARGKYTNPSSPVDITVSGQAASGGAGATSCAIKGVGWIICSMSNFMGDGMDWVYNAISGFLSVKPVTTDTDSTLYQAWSYMRGFANIAFVIGFLIIIYSQLTSYGISNYGIKKLLPRLVVAAILVNISYYICAIAVDISNVLGYSLEKLFVDLQHSLTWKDWEPINFHSMVGFVLSGGTAATAGGIGLFVTLTTYGVTGSIFLLLPVLVSGLMSVLVALLVLAGRQAMIIVLIMISPLAFVAYLLPNTEKWFEKWKSTFLTMMIMFPAFAIVFGGAQLASAIIIQSADNINLVILGMLVQVAPLMITPLLLKLSGSTLNQLANFANKLNSRVVDRTKKFTDDRAENIKARRLGEEADPRWRGALQRQAQASDHRRRRRESWRNAHNSMADARWANSRDFSDVDQAIREAADKKSVGEQRSQLRYTNRKVTDDRIQSLDTELRTLKVQNDNANLRADRQWERNQDPTVAAEKLAFRALTDQVAAIKAEEDATYKIYKNRKYQGTAEYASQSATMQALIQDAANAADDIAIHTMRGQSAESYKQKEIAEILRTSGAARDLAGAAIIDKHGSARVEAAAFSALSKAEAEAITNQVTLLGMRATEANQTLKDYSKGIAKQAIDGTIPYAGNEDIITAAFEAQALEGNMSLFEEARGSANLGRSGQDTISKVIARNAGKFKEKGGFHLQASPTLNIVDNPNYWQDIQSSRIISLGDVSAGQLKDLKGGWIEDMAKHMTDPSDPNYAHMLGAITDPGNDVAVQKIYDNLMLALNDDGIRGQIGDRITFVEQIKDAIRTQRPTITQTVKPSGSLPGNGPAPGSRPTP